MKFHDLAKILWQTSHPKCGKHDQVSVVYTVEVPGCAVAAAPATEQPAAAEAAATEQPATEQAATAPNPDEAAKAPDAAAAAVPAEGQNAKMEVSRYFLWFVGCICEQV